MPGADRPAEDILAAGSGYARNASGADDRGGCRVEMPVGVDNGLRAKAADAQDEQDVLERFHATISVPGGRSRGDRSKPAITATRERRITRRCRNGRRSGAPSPHRFRGAGRGPSSPAWRLAAARSGLGGGLRLRRFGCSGFSDGRRVIGRQHAGPGSRRPEPMRKPEAGRKSGSICACEVSLV